MISYFLPIASLMERIFLKFYYVYKRKKILSSFKQAPESLVFDPFSKFIDPHLMSFGENVFINRAAHFSGEIEFGKNIMLGPNVSIFSHNHLFGVLGRSNREISKLVINSKVVIKDETWIGNNVTVLSGVTINEGAVIGAGAVVFKNIPPFVIVGSNNKILGLIFSDKNLYVHLEKLGYKKDVINKIINKRIQLTKGEKLEIVEKQLTDANENLDLL